MTKHGWRSLFPPLAPTPEPPAWGSKPGAAAAYDALFMGSDGKDVRVTSRWYHVLRKVAR